MKFTAIDKLRPGMRIGQKLPGITHKEKYALGYPLSENDILYLCEKGIVGVYTMEDAPADILSYDLMCDCISALKKTDLHVIIPLADRIVAELQTRPRSLDFKSIRSYDEYLLHHSICVAVYAVSIGIQMKMTNSQLLELALAGLLHDIGLLLSDQSILRKKGALSAEEYEQIKKHPQEGCDFLKKDRRISAAVQEAVLQHHENMNGTGYPGNHNEDTLSVYSRILHIADVYDAIMAKRPYKNGMSNADAINYLIGGKMILFDEHIVDKFIQIAVPYPTGIEIRLSNDETGRVIGQNADPLRPIIYQEDKRQIINLTTHVSYQDVTVVNEAGYEHNSPKQSISETEASSSADSPSRRKKKIMIVDDIFVSIAYTKLSLGDDYDFISCLGGTKAAVMAAAEKPDLILMDYEMPDRDGASAAAEIHRMNLKIPIIFLTGKCDKETVHACGHSGAVDYILKPANPVYLRTRVALALQRADGKAFI